MFRFDSATSRLHLEEGGAPVGRMEILDNAPHDVVLVHPRVEAGRDPCATAAALVAEAVRRADAAGVRHVEMYFDDRAPHADAFVAAAPSWGFDLDAARLLVRAMRDELRLDAVPPPAAGAEFVADDRETADVLGRVLATSATPSDRAADPRQMIDGFIGRCRAAGCLHPEDWVVLRVDGAAVGVVFPAFLEADRQAATNFYVGVVPEARGRGFGAQLLRRGVETMLRRGATRYVGTCDVGNEAMRRAFERIGCARVATRHVFTRSAARLPR
jgi:RimJ/RimL family protein N-acetyltransferase